jgi:hypothetical protein
MFFGRDLLKMNSADMPVGVGASVPASGEGRVYLNHNRDIGMLARDRLIVLGLMQTDEFYQGNPKVIEMTPLSHPTEDDLELEKDAIAIYQVADDLYMHQRYRLD